MHRFEPVRTGSNGFKKILTCANQGLNHAFGSGLTLDFEPNFGPVRKSSGSNLGSEPDCGSTRTIAAALHVWTERYTGMYICKTIYDFCKFVCRRLGYMEIRQPLYERTSVQIPKRRRVHAGWSGES